ncbi:Asp-tRNA(Asn)/Glu-tRNA(Gln) amidotransferase subunit GatA [Pontiella sulfatireligans]|uniref:Glutamyl-tRNA(Gln) amidotransferase subunit A n=1 Tax=Pontiella sulfatireligans TaxID=2750658 RepID=A0A6C2ULD3_9BACT|nr:Asp-tRNA(Asn)/Glu-tRNA(Gln) amidotransferase subunit GatA [Pontiella sulfatireligans]VGO20114.1 Glutamyl-tRNA(Gln) amidotransferase subunit A [Pontiella sulfatireligans]
MADLHKLTISELTEQLASGTCTSVDIVNDVLASIDATDGKVGAYLTIDREDALAQAKAADEARAAGSQLPMLGIPVAIKDLLNVKGQPCTCSSKILEGYIAPYDATVIAKLREAGAVLLGRVNMDEFAMGSSTENAALGKTSNPWNLDHVPGGSSGGSAACVAADEAIASLGSDTGGSIRQPAAFCGCVGVKPTYGRVSRYGLTAFASSLDQIGPLTKTVKDSAILLEVLCGHDKMDSSSIEMDVPAFAKNLSNGTSLAGMKLGLPKEYFVVGMDPEVEQSVRDAVEHCKSLGAEIIDVSLPNAKYAIAVYYIIATAEASANLARFDGIRYGMRIDGKDPIELYGKTRAAGFGSEVKRRIILGTYVLSSGYYDAYYLRAQKVRTLIRDDFTEAFKQCDAILSPVTPTPAYKLGEKSDDPLKMYLDDILTTPINLAGNCALSLPCGFASNGMPIGLQIIGDAFQEETILKVGHAFEQTTEWHKKRPSL